MQDEPTASAYHSCALFDIAEKLRLMTTLMRGVRTQDFITRHMAVAQLNPTPVAKPSLGRRWQDAGASKLPDLLRAAHEAGEAVAAVGLTPVLEVGPEPGAARVRAVLWALTKQRLLPPVRLLAWLAVARPAKT